MRSQEITKTDRWCAPYRVMMVFEEKYPQIAAKYFDLRYETRGSLNIPLEQEVEQ